MIHMQRKPRPRAGTSETSVASNATESGPPEAATPSVDPRAAGEELGQGKANFFTNRWVII